MEISQGSNIFIHQMKRFFVVSDNLSVPHRCCTRGISTNKITGTKKKTPRVAVAFAAGEFSWRSGVTWKKIG